MLARSFQSRQGTLSRITRGTSERISSNKSLIEERLLLDHTMVVLKLVSTASDDADCV